MPKFPAQPFTAVYVIYSADVVGDEADITRMSPASHMPAGHNGDAQTERARVAALFEQTEGDDQYDFGYLGKDGLGPRYFPAGYLDAEATVEPDADTDPDLVGCGYHRKWVADLTRDEWLIFADAYLIDLDDAGYPESYEETMGSLTEHGHLEAIAVSNSEGWQDFHGPQFVDSNMYVSFAYATDPNGSTP